MSNNDTLPSASETLKQLLSEFSEKKLPPVHLWHPERTGESEMRIARDGSWYYQGSRIQRERMVRLFSTVLRHDDDGQTYLVTPQERLRIEVEDAPFTAVLMQQHGSGQDQVLEFTTNTGERVLAGEHHPIECRYHRPEGEPSPYILVRDRLQALLTRSVYYQLAELLITPSTEGDEQWGVYSQRFFMPLASF